MSKSLDPDQDRLNVGPDLGPNCLLMSSTDDKKLPRKEFILIECNKEFSVVSDQWL